MDLDKTTVRATNTPKIFKTHHFHKQGENTGSQTTELLICFQASFCHFNAWRFSNLETNIDNIFALFSCLKKFLFSAVGFNSMFLES